MLLMCQKLSLLKEADVSACENGRIDVLQGKKEEEKRGKEKG